MEIHEALNLMIAFANLMMFSVVSITTLTNKKK